MRTPHLDHVVRLYDATQEGYEKLWSRDYLRYGFWEESTRTLAESLINTDRFVAELLQVKPDELVLDAGCGVGGSAIFLARTHGCRVTGVNICASQLAKAQRKVREAGLEDRVFFLEQDFCATNLADASVAKLFAIESMYHVESIRRFVAEAYRLLKPGGRLVVVDRFLLRTTMNKVETYLYKRFRSGQAVVELPTESDFRKILESEGFARVEFADKLPALWKGIARTQRISRLTYPTSLVLSALRILPHETHEQTVALLAATRLFRRGVLTYGGFVAEKPGPR